ncbi:hypothetical protein L873DRAFT_1714069 [Choiromyces venosus 120613-1]|uniref:Cupredoxin n=1 Tax=Choiromyces venosus 120613-1 TaxID=1336337 RepID=A0A3N4J4J0_9PEZI|nr:hypothetical protein L873DRAFT_1714069 [Choiromyces venosus 120613-1]
MSVHAIALALDVVLFLSLFTDAQRVLVVSVGREGEELALRFSPEEVYANVGDQVQFQFYPLNHSAVQANFERPCVPISNITTGQGFFPGFRLLPLDTKIITTFTVNITHTDPIFFYCSQGRHCQQGFVGVINPLVHPTAIYVCLVARSNVYDRTPKRSLEGFKASASLAPDNLSPGERPSVPTIIPTPRSSNRFNFTNADNDKTITNVGAIVGSILGGVIFLVILVTLVVFPVMRKKGD